MFYNVIQKFFENSLIVRMIGAFSLSLILSFLLAKKYILFIKKFQNGAKKIRKYYIKDLTKSTTPILGGVIIIISSVISSFVFINLLDSFFWVVMFSFLSFSGLGFIDDYLKIKNTHYHGLSVRKKIFFQVLISIISYYLYKYFSSDGLEEVVFFLNKQLFSLEGYYVVFAILVIVGCSNAVNLTDGLDGLAIKVVIHVLICFGIAIYVSADAYLSEYFSTTYTGSVNEILIIIFALLGGSLCFLWYNAKPAEVFLGDTGSLALGGVIGTISVITKKEFFLAIVGIILVVETLSVIIQVSYFKISKGKRVFLMSPVHHHFQMLKINEEKIVERFSIFSLIFSIIGLFLLLFI